jgi:hypothetical protein
VFAKGRPKSVQSLTKCISCIRLTDVTPEQVDELVSSSFAPDGQIREESQRLSWSQAGYG